MNVKEFSRLQGSIFHAQETAEDLRKDMKILNRHETYAEPEVVLKAAESIIKELESALEQLTKIGADSITKVAGNGT